MRLRGELSPWPDCMHVRMLPSTLHFGHMVSTIEVTDQALVGVGYSVAIEIASGDHAASVRKL